LNPAHQPLREHESLWLAPFYAYLAIEASDDLLFQIRLGRVFAKLEPHLTLDLETLLGLVV
jgi:hypothetical protein